VSDESKRIIDSYEKGKCPGCGKKIPKNVKHGQSCFNCEYAFDDPNVKFDVDYVEVDANGNCNNLKGMQCPEKECESFNGFDIAVRTTIEMYDNGSGHHEDLEFDNDATATCQECGLEGTVQTFKDGYAAVQARKTNAPSDPSDAFDPSEMGGPFGS
jgi:hypothetical protein